MDLTLTGKTKVVSPTAANFYPSRYGWLSLEFAEPNLGAPPEGTLLALLTSDDYGNRGWADFSLTQPFSSLERPDLTAVDEALEWLLYRYPAFTTFTVQNSSNYFIELGTGETVTISWSSVKVDPRAIITYSLFTSAADDLDYEFLQTGDYTFSSFNVNVPITLTPTITTYRIFTTDWAGNTAEDFSSFSFVGRIFIGAIDSSLVPPLCSDILSNTQFTYIGNSVNFKGSVNCTPTNNEPKRAFVAYPAYLGNIPPTSIGGFSYTWQTFYTYLEFVYTPLNATVPVVLPYRIYISNNEHTGFLPIIIG